MHPNFRWMVLGCLVTLFSFTSVQAEDIDLVLVISIDALHPEALQRTEIPNIGNLMRMGTYTLDGRSTDPPKTLIAHTAMLTGLPPIENGKLDNMWAPGETTVKVKTLFDAAKDKGYKTGYFYSKEKLGYLVNDAIDVHQLSRDNAIDLAEAFIKTPGPHFVFLHVSGLDQVGPQYGWLSPEYLEELTFIDDYLTSILDLAKEKKRALLIITSDHAGHDKIHGSQHQEDFRLPLILYSDTIPVKLSRDQPFSIVHLKDLVEGVLWDTAVRR